MDQLAAYKFINDIIVYSNAAVRDNRRQLALLGNGNWFDQVEAHAIEIIIRKLFIMRLGRHQFITHFHCADGGVCVCGCV